MSEPGLRGSPKWCVWASKRLAELEAKEKQGCVHNDLVYLEEVIERRNEKIAALEAQVAKMPVLMGYVSEDSIIAITQINQSALVRILPPVDIDRRNYFPIYLDPPQEQGE